MTDQSTMQAMNKWFLGIASSVILLSGGAQVATLVSLAEVKRDIAHVQAAAGDSYTRSVAEQDHQLQLLVDKVQDDALARLKDRVSKLESKSGAR